jgi:hypothetical protein
MTDHIGVLTTNDSPRAEWASNLSILGGVVFVALLIILHLLKSELDPTWVPISYYALGEHSWLMTAAFIAWSLSAFGLLFALLGIIRGLTGKIGLGFLTIAAASPLLAALFPTDALTIPADQTTVPGTIHNVAAVLSDAYPIAAALITWALIRNQPRWAKYRTTLITTALLTWTG